MGQRTSVYRMGWVWIRSWIRTDFSAPSALDPLRVGHLPVRTCTRIVARGGVHAKSKVLYTRRSVYTRFRYDAYFEQRWLAKTMQSNDWFEPSCQNRAEDCHSYSSVHAKLARQNCWSTSGACVELMESMGATGTKPPREDGRPRLGQPRFHTTTSAPLLPLRLPAAPLGTDSFASRDLRTYHCLHRHLCSLESARKEQRGHKFDDGLPVSGSEEGRGPWELNVMTGKTAPGVPAAWGDQVCIVHLAAYFCHRSRNSVTAWLLRF